MTAAQACEATAVSDGGTISGSITLLGAVPPARPIKGPLNAREYVAEVPDERLIVGANRGMKSVAVWVMEIIVPAGGAVEIGSGHRL